MRWPSVSTAVSKPCKRVSGVPTNVQITVRRRRGVSDTAGTQQISRPNAHGCVPVDRRSTHRWQNSALKSVKRVPMSVTSTITITVRCVPAYCEIVRKTVATWHSLTALLYSAISFCKNFTDVAQREALNYTRATLATGDSISTRTGPDRNRMLHRFPRVHQARPVLLGDFVRADRQHHPYRAEQLSE